MHKLPRKAYRVLEKARRSIDRYGMLQGGEKVLVAVSGGPDSLVLLDVLWRLSDPMALRLEVFHVDHGLRPASADDAEYVGRVAAAYGLPFASERVEVERRGARGRMSPEEAAREARYAALERRLAGGGFDRAALGHQADDRVETFLLRLVTGAGPRALASIPPVRGPYIRPLIEVWESELGDYLGCLPLPPLSDPTNLDPAVPRNRVRHGLLPYLESEFNPAVKASLARVLELLAEERAEAVPEGWQDIPVSAAAAIELNAFDELPLAGRRLLLWRKLLAMGIRPTFQLVEDLRVNICGGRSGSRMALPSGWEAVREYDRVVVFKSGEAEPPPGGPESRETLIEGEGDHLFAAAGISLEVEFLEDVPGMDEITGQGPWEAFLDLDRLEFPLQARLIRPGDRFFPLGAPGSRKVQDFLTDAKVPRRLRSRTLAVLSDGRIAWLVGQRIDDRFKVTASTRRVARLRAGAEPPDNGYNG